MIRYIISVFILLNFTISAQTRKEVLNVLKQINTESNIEKFQLKNPEWRIELIKSNTAKTDIPKKLNKLKIGKSKRINLDQENFHYKLISNKPVTEFRASYIYLNGSELNKKQIDSLRSVIIEKYRTGISFEKLAEKFNMDGNSKKGDLGWFKKGVMVPAFEKSVQEHKKDDVFLVDIDSHKWYYVVLKTYDDRVTKDLMFVRIKEQ